jgi:hypothetical protein
MIQVLLHLLLTPKMRGALTGAVLTLHIHAAAAAAQRGVCAGGTITGSSLTACDWGTFTLSLHRACGLHKDRHLCIENGFGS